MFKTKTFVLTPLLALLAVPLSAGYSLQLQQTTSSDGTSVEVGVDYVAGGDELAALVFTVEYDTSRLRFDSQAKSADTLQNIRIATPAEFSSSSYFLADRDQIGITLYDSTLPLAILPSGRVATLKFDVLPGASGFAFVRFSTSPAVSGSDARGIERRPELTAPGGVTVSSRRPLLNVLPSALDFGSVRVNSEASRRIIVSNDGTGPLSLKSVAFQGDSAYSLPSGGPRTLEAGGSYSYDVLLKAPSPGVYQGNVSVELTSGEVVTVPLTATVLTDGNYSYDSRWYVPALVRAPGAAGSNWRTELHLLNSGSSALSVRLTPHDANGNVLTPQIFELAPGTARRIDDVVEASTGKTEFRGYLLVESSSPDLIGRAAIANVFADGSRKIESVPLLTPSRTFHTAESAFMVGLAQSGTARTNVGILNASPRTCAVTATLRSATGERRGSRLYVVSPNQLAEPLDLFSASGVTDEHDLTISFDSGTSDCAYFPFATFIDASGNLTFIYPR
jgi:hypothetical protein